MRFEIDTTAKTITVMQECTIQELNDLMRKFIGEKEMKEYRITFKQEFTNIGPIIPATPHPWSLPWTPQQPNPYIQPNSPIWPGTFCTRLDGTEIISLTN